jgi:uncharacterized delta-60 repeat protein
MLGEVIGEANGTVTGIEVVSVEEGSPKLKLRRTVGAMTMVLGLYLALLAYPAGATPGDLDSSFGSGGTVATSFGVAAHDVAIQPDGRIVAAGYDTVSGNDVFAVARYLPNGYLDPTFGGDGTVTTDIGCDPADSVGSAHSSAKAVVIQRIDEPSGPVDKVLLAGYRYYCGADLPKWVLVRYEPHGSLDPTFGVAGVVQLPFGVGSSSGITDLALDAVGRIVAVGSVNPGTPALVSGEQFGVARLLPNGTPDPSFGEGGMTVTRAGRSYSRAAAVALTTVEVGGGVVEAIVVAGEADGHIGLSRYLPNGVLDPTFGTNGTTTSVYSDGGAQDLAVQADGKLVVAGGDRLARFTSVGGLDGDFASKGFTVSDYWMTGVAVQDRDGAIVAGGYVTGGDLPPRFAVARYRSDGSADASFGGGGVVKTLVGGTYSKANALALQSDGMIVLAGGRPFKLARYQAAGPPPTVPDAPSLTATAGNASVHLAWTTPPDGGSAISGYRIYRGIATGAETLLASVGSVNSFDDTAVANGTRYFYRVSAVNAVDEGTLSNEVTATPATVPGAPSLTAAGGKPMGIALSWTAPPNGGSPITGYRIYRGTASGGKTFLKAVGTVTSYNDRDTTKGTAYYYAVRAVNDVGEGSASNEASASAN